MFCEVSMKMVSSLLSILSRVANKMGYQELRAKQHKAILALMRGWDVFVALPTSCGKLLCYSVLPGKAFDAVLSESGQQSVAIIAVVCNIPVICGWLNASETIGSLWQSFNNVLVTILRHGRSSQRFCSGCSTNKHKTHTILSMKNIVMSFNCIPILHEKHKTAYLAHKNKLLELFSKPMA